MIQIEIEKKYNLTEEDYKIINQILWNINEEKLKQFL